MKIEHISISRESTFNECPQNYKYKYEIKMVPKEEPIHFFYGKVVHKIIEKYTLAKGMVRIEDITSNVMSGDIKLEHNSVGKLKPLPFWYREKLPTHLRNFLKLSQHLGTEGEVEWNFSFDLDPPYGRKLVGFIDRMIPKDDKMFIVDFKTTKKGKWRKTKETVHNDLQLQSYARVVQKEFGLKAENIKTALYYLEDAELISASFSQKTLDSVEGRLLNVYKNIEKTPQETVIGTPGEHCFHCDYKAVCPFYKK